MSEGEEAGFRRIGTHLLRMEPPDLLYVRQQGDFLLEHCVAVVEEVRKLAEVGGPILWLTDARELGEVPPESRRFIGTSGVDEFTLASAIFGFSFTQRILTKFVTNAVGLVHRGRPPTPIQFFAGEAEARAWLTEIRRASKAKAAR